MAARGTYIASELPVVQIALEKDNLARLEVLVELLGHAGQPPEAPRVGPEAVGPQDDLPFSIELTPVLEEEGQILGFLVRERRRRLVLEHLVL